MKNSPIDLDKINMTNSIDEFKSKTIGITFIYPIQIGNSFFY
jgi:hypothetical protein